jgi:hypothetical protein
VAKAKSLIQRLTGAPELLDGRQAADAIGVSLYRLMQLCLAGQVPTPLRTPDGLRWSKTALRKRAVEKADPKVLDEMRGIMTLRSRKPDWGRQKRA